MELNIPSRVKNVRIEVLGKVFDESYRDKAEDTLLQLFTQDSSEKIIKDREDLLRNGPSWPIFYHLTPYRDNLLAFYNFKPGSRVLEIGAGCGAVTEGLVKKDIELTALELTPKRSLINAHRNRDAKNLNVTIGNLSEFNPKERFDYIVCVGVLEYAGTFLSTSEKPYVDFVAKLKALLKPGGVALIAIENRLGMKYWSGAKEDHTQGFFDGINGYPGEKKVQTFGRKELSSLLHDGGFKDTLFFYPFPDYKTPFFVYSDNYLPGEHTQFPLSQLPTPTLDRPREDIFSEQNLMMHLENNGLFADFSNSFLVEAKI